MVGGWTTRTFGDLIDSGVLFVSDGYRAKNEELGGDGYIFLRAGHVTDSCVDFASAECFHSALSARVANKVSKPGDVMVTTKGSTGRVSYVTADMPPFVYSPHLSFWRSLKPDILAPGFLRYWPKSREFRRQLEAMEASTDMAPYLSLVDQKHLQISLPPWRDQNAIAEILGSLDEKIDLNRKVNGTLEDMACTIFKSWFVDFGPVREGHPLFPHALGPSAIGKIPQEWRVGTLGDIAENPRRGIVPADILPGTAYIGLEHMPRRSIALELWESADGVESNKFCFFQGDILFGKLRPYFHKVGVAAVDGVCSTDILVVVPRQDIYFGFVLALVSSEEFVQYTDRGSAGTKMPRTNWTDMARYKTIIPPEPVARAFNEAVRSMVNKIAGNIHESRTLAALRDTLLPKLLSGEIRIKQAEKIVGEAV